MKTVKRYVSLILLLCACFFCSVPAALAGGEAGTIQCGVQGELFSGEPYNHYHFQRNQDFPTTVEVYCSFTDSNGELMYRQTIEDNNVYEWFPGGELYCEGRSDAPVSFSATEEDHAH